MAPRAMMPLLLAPVLGLVQLASRAEVVVC
jgi:hypothetical protein